MRAGCGTLLRLVHNATLPACASATRQGGFQPLGHDASGSPTIHTPRSQFASRGPHAGARRRHAGCEHARAGPGRTRLALYPPTIHARCGSGSAYNGAMQAWTRIERWLAAHLPEAIEDLRPPASQDELRAVERALGEELPLDVHALYRLHDGQASDTPGVFMGLPFLPLHSVVAAWESWQDVVDASTDEEVSAHCTSEPPGAVRAAYTCSGWVPLSDDYGGNHLGVDLAPGPRGERGQIINFGRDELHKFVLAGSLDDFLRKVGDLLEAGNYRIEDTGTDGRALYLDAPRVDNLLDAAAFVAAQRIHWIH